MDNAAGWTVRGSGVYGIEQLARITSRIVVAREGRMLVWNCMHLGRRSSLRDKR
jgi:hypothetical protein